MQVLQIYKKAIQTIHTLDLHILVVVDLQLGEDHMQSLGKIKHQSSAIRVVTNKIPYKPIQPTGLAL